jgi:glycerol uptake facilitator-like aquaporin
LFAYGIGCASKELAIDFIHSATLLLALAISGEVTGGYFNSSITIAAYFNKKHRFLVPYLLGQIGGGTLGALWYTVLLGNTFTPYVDQPTFDLIKFLIN